LAKPLALRLLNRWAVGGIIGKLSFEADETLARPVLEQMLNAVRHRGNSVQGFHCAPGIALGWCTAPDEHVPPAGLATNEAQTIRVVSDSQLTNARELRALLERDRHQFRGMSDPELIAHAYEEWGVRCVERFRGPFAFALWDETARRLVMARDHLGVRPLFFALLHGHGVVFASEIRALLNDPGVSREWCPTAINAYLALGYVPAPLTAYRRISKLEPAQFLVVEGRRLHVEQYWDLPMPAQAGTLEETATALEHRLRSAMRGQLKDNHVNGVLYSGGTASSTLLTTTPRHAASSDERLTTVMVALEQDASELARAHAAATALGHAPEIEVATPDMSILAGQLAARFDEPIADPSAIAQYATCVAARLHVDCAVTAHGAAALWAGYARHRVERVEATLRTWLAAPLASVGAHVARALHDSVKGARALSRLGMHPADACAIKHSYGLWDEEHRRQLYTRGFAWEVRDANPFARHLELYTAREGADALERALYVDVRTSLPDSLLAVAERSALAAGLRLRFPLLDREFVEFAASIPSAHKQHGATGMLALHALLSRRLPPALMPAAQRRPAQHPWLPAALAAMVPGVLLAPRFDGRGIVSRPALRQLWDEHRAGLRDHSHRLWSLLMLEFWFREFIDGDAAEEPMEYAVLMRAA
jgi:asparagine synthase (glutamine-hydrolysing)